MSAIWTTRDGQRIPVAQMTDTHLVNAMRLIERAARRATDEAITSGYQALGVLHGDMAQLSVEQGITALEEEGIDPSTITPLYDALHNEYLRRLASGRPMEAL